MILQTTAFAMFKIQRIVPRRGNRVNGFLIRVLIQQDHKCVFVCVKGGLNEEGKAKLEAPALLPSV